MSYARSTPRNVFHTPEFWSGAVAPVLIAGWVVPVVLLRAFVLTKLWEWYIIPAFGAQPLRMVFAFGLALFANFLLPRRERNGDKNLTWLFVASFLDPAISLLLGWIGSFFV